MSITPTISFTTIGNLSDVLKELPLPSAIGYNYNSNANQPLINNKQHFDFANELLNSSDPTLIQELANTLNQIDSSNIIIRTDVNENQIPVASLPAVLQKALYYSPNLFNGSFNHQTQNVSQQQQIGVQYLPQQHELLSPQHKPHSLQSPPAIYQQQTQVHQQSLKPAAQPQHQDPLQVVHNIIQKNETPVKINNVSQYQHQQSPNQIENIKVAKELTPTTSSANDRTILQDSNAKKQQPEYSIVSNNNINECNKLTLKVSLKRLPVNLEPTAKASVPCNPEYTIEQIFNQDRRVEDKLTSSEKNEYKIKSNKFYTSKEPETAKVSSKPPVQPHAARNVDENSNDKLKRKPSAHAKANLNTWQANITSQLDLPSDFTPELIAQLASEGYDVVTGSRKGPRAIRQNPTNNQAEENDVDDEDEDDDNFELKISNSKNQQQMTGTPSKLLNKNKEKKPMQKIESLNFKREQEKQLALTNLDLLEHPTEHPSFKKFTQLIEDLFESYDVNFHNKIKLSALNTDDILDEYLINTKLCSELSQEAYKLNTYSLVNLMRKENLMKLQTILYFNIKDGIKQMDLSDDQAKGEQDKLLRDILFDKFIRAADSSITSLYIMTAEKINKEVIMEDLVEQISLFSKLHLTTTIFPHYDVIYRNNNFDPSKAAAMSSATHSNNIKRTKPNFNGAPSSNSGQKIFKYIQHFYNRLREILNLIGDLIQIIDLTDTIIITLSSMCIMCFFVDNISELQLEAMKILTNIFSKYEKHRQLIFDDILSSLAKLHSNKRNLRSYKCLNNEMIQMVSALSLQLIQCEVSCLNENTRLTEETSEELMKSIEQAAANTNVAVISFEEKETFMINTYENSSLTAKKFLSVFFHKCKSKQNEFDFRPIFENFIQDLLITVNKPEWPASELILNMLGVILVNQINNEQNDVASRVNSLEYLGQIVSTLRKDALETSKNPDKLKSVFKKIVSSNEKLLLMNYEKEINFDELAKDTEVLLQLQKTLILYLDSLEISDASIQYAKRFFVAQWLKEISTSSGKNEAEFGEEQVEKYTSLENQRKELYDLIEARVKCSSGQSASNVLDFGEAFMLCKYLCSLKKSLDKNFDYYLVNILNLLGGSNEVNTPTQVRSKAIKCLSLLIEADAQILLKQKVFTCVQANFLHQTISVREAAVDLIGRFITLRPELTKHYYNLLSDRILDVGVSVRKRVIKIFRDICINQPTFDCIAEICVKILRRINDEDGIKKLVIDTFYNLWFVPISTQEQLLQRVLNMVDVISEFSASSNIAQSTEFFEQLFGYLMEVKQPTGSSSNTDVANKETSGETASSENQIQKTKDVLRSCKQIVDCLVENVLNTEANTTTPQAYKRLVSSFSTLHLLSKIKPENFINHAETLLPYLNIKSTNQHDNQIINSAARILESVTPLLHCPSNSFLVSLEESLCKLIFQGGMMIVNSCINCLGAVVNKLTKNYKLAADCFSKFYKNGVVIRANLTANKPLDQATKAYSFRMLFTLGLLAKQFDLDSTELKEFEICSKDDLFKLYMFFIKQSDIDTKQKALIGLGSFLTRYSDYMLTTEIKSIYLSYLTGANVPIMLKSQVFTNLTDYLNEEDKRNLAESHLLTKTHCKDDLKEMLDVQSGMASTIIQSYFKPILESYLTSNVNLRISVVNCLNQILNQGLIYPIECVPYLIAMTTDMEKKIQVKSLTHLTNLHKAHPGFIQSKSISGLNLSFRLQKIVQAHEKTAANQNDPEIVVRGITDTNNEILSLNHHLYSLLRGQRSFRRAFIQQLLKMFDDSSAYHASLGHLFYICDNLAYFPYQLIDEPLYLIHQIDIIISVTGVNILQSFKENLITRKAKPNNDKQSGNRVTESSDMDTDKMCLDLDMSHIYPSEEEEGEEADEDEEAVEKKKAVVIPKKISVYDDDEEEETLDYITANLPSDLKPLKDCMMNAQGCCLLLILKQFLKEVYSITDVKIQNYSPTDLAKVNDKPIGSRRMNFKFNPKQIIEYLKDSNKAIDNDELKVKLAKEYLEFKELMLSIDYEDEAADESKKQVIQVDQMPGGVTVATTTTTSAAATATVPTCALKLRLLEGIEKVNTISKSNSSEQVPTTPRSAAKNSSNRVKRVGGLQSSAAKKLSMKKRKRKKDAVDSTEESDYKNSESDEDF